MKKIMLGLLIAISVMFISGCASSSAKPDLAKNIVDPYDDVKAFVGCASTPVLPEWINNPESTVDTHVFVGIAVDYAGDRSIVAKDARFDAQQQFAEYLNRFMAEEDDRMRRTSGQTKEKVQTFIDKVDTAIAVTIADPRGLMPGRNYFDVKDNTYYQEMIFSKDIFLENFKQETQKDLLNESTLYSQQEADKLYKNLQESLGLFK